MKLMIRMNEAEVAAVNNMMSTIAEKEIGIGEKTYESEALTTEVRTVDDFTVIGIDADAEMVADFAETLGDTMGKYMALVKIFTKNTLKLMDKWFKKGE